MKFVQVGNKINSISTKEVEFENGKGTTTTLRRIHNKKTIWLLRKDGIYVNREFALAYKLEIV